MQANASSKRLLPLVDEYTAIRARMRARELANEPDALRLEIVEHLILQEFEKTPADQTAIAVGTRYSLPISKRRTVRTVIKIREFIRHIGGVDAVAKHWKPALKLVEKLVSAEDLSKFIEEARTGARSIGEPVDASAPDQIAA